MKLIDTIAEMIREAAWTRDTTIEVIPWQECDGIRITYRKYSCHIIYFYRDGAVAHDAIGPRLFTNLITDPECLSKICNRVVSHRMISNKACNRLIHRLEQLQDALSSAEIGARLV